MGSDLRYSLINSFRSIDDWRANVIFNMFGSVTPGFKRRDIFLGVKAGQVDLSASEAGNANVGMRAGARGGNSELTVDSYKLNVLQSKPTIETGSDASPRHLSIVGDGFFAVAESLSPGARIFYTRDGSFDWKKTGQATDGSPVYNLVNSQGLYVLRMQDIDFNGKTGVMKLKGSERPGMVLTKGLLPPGRSNDGYFTDSSGNKPAGILGLLGSGKWDSPVPQMSQAQIDAAFNDRSSTAYNSDLAIVKIPGSSNLIPSSYGGQIYEAPLNARQGIVPSALKEWYRQEGANAPHILPYSLEYLDSQAELRQLEVQSQLANFVYQNLSTFMQDYNKSQDDLLGLVK